MSHHDMPDTVRCPIGVRETVSGDGAVKRRLMAHCDHRGEAVELMDCVDCALRVNLRPPTARRSGSVDCRRVASHDDRPRLAADGRMPVRLVMERDVACLRPDVSVDAAAVLLLAQHVGSAPVVDESGHPVGVVSLRDVMPGRWDPGGAPTGPRSVADVMSPLVFTVFENTELSRAVAVMSAVGLQQLPVVRGDGSVVGLLSMASASRMADAGDDRRVGAPPST